jgi:cbb3-type cytochrome oxidase maturation protein
MAVIFILIIASLVVAIGFLLAFVWSVNKGQFDDVQTPAMRILFEDGVKKPKEKEKGKTNTLRNK